MTTIDKLIRTITLILVFWSGVIIPIALYQMLK